VERRPLRCRCQWCGPLGSLPPESCLWPVPGRQRLTSILHDAKSPAGRTGAGSCCRHASALSPAAVAERVHNLPRPVWSGSVVRSAAAGRQAALSPAWPAALARLVASRQEAVLQGAWEMSYTTPGVLRPAGGAAGVGNRLAWKAERQSNTETSNELRRNGLISPILRKHHKPPI